MNSASPSAKPVQTDMAPKNPLPLFLPRSGNQTAGPQNEKNGSEEIRKLRKLEQAGIKIRPASHRDDGRLESWPGMPFTFWHFAVCCSFLGVGGFFFDVWSYPFT